MRLGWRHRKRTADHQNNVSSDDIGKRRLCVCKTEHQNADQGNDEAQASKQLGPHAVIHSPGKCRDQGIDDAARQHDDAGHGNGKHHGVLDELRHEIHRGQNDAEIKHDEDGAGPEGRLGEDSEVQDWFIKLQLTSCIKDEHDDADGKKTEHPW